MVTNSNIPKSPKFSTISIDFACLLLFMCFLFIRFFATIIVCSINNCYTYNCQLLGTHTCNPISAVKITQTDCLPTEISKNHEFSYYQKLTTFFVNGKCYGHFYSLVYLKTRVLRFNCIPMRLNNNIIIVSMYSIIVLPCYIIILILRFNEVYLNTYCVQVQICIGLLDDIYADSLIA